jgi:hypothetical protein
MRHGTKRNSLHMSTSSGSAIKVCTWCGDAEGGGSPNDLVSTP